MIPRTMYITGDFSPREALLEAVNDLLKCLFAALAFTFYLARAHPGLDRDLDAKLRRRYANER